MAYELDVLIYKKNESYKPAVLDGFTIDMEMNSPSRMDFSVIKQKDYTIQEGDRVTVTKKVDGKQYNIFYGFIFSKSLGKDDVLKLTAYDQLRYFKNKHLLIYENLTLGGVFKKCCEDFNLNYVIKADNTTKIAYRAEIDKSLFDITQYALDYAFTKDSRIFIIYDNFGVLTLNRIVNMNRFVGDNKKASDFSYETSIDNETYNKILVYKEFDKTNFQKVISENKSLESQWGTLQLVQKADNDVMNMQNIADNLLRDKSKKEETFSLNDLPCKTWIKAGDAVLIELEVNNKKVSQYMLVQSIKHKFNALHTADIKLIGGMMNA